MPWKYLEEEAIADIGIVVTAETLCQLYADACMSIATLMTDVDRLQRTITKEVELTEENPEDNLYLLLDELVYLKDAELFFVKEAKCDEDTVTLTGDTFDRERHPIGNDIKAITMHELYVKQTSTGWEAHFIIDI